MPASSPPLITNDASVLGVLALLLGAVFWLSQSERSPIRHLFDYVPALLFCYFLPAVLNTLHVIDGEHSRLYFVASRYLLPTTLVLLTLSIDLPAIRRLGSKAIIMFLTGTVGVVLGGPIAIFLMSWIHPAAVGGAGPDAVWRGLTTVAGSWIGGGANQAAMKEVFGVSDRLFSSMVAVDVIVANLWMAVLLYMAGISKRLDGAIGADTRAIDALRRKVEAFEAEHARIPRLYEVMLICAVGFGATGLAHFLADWVAPSIERAAPALRDYSLTSSFFWLVVLATTFGVALSFTGARKLEGAGASKLGSAMLYFLVATIGMHMDIAAIWRDPWLFGVGLLWMLVHAGLMLSVSRMIKAPTFFMAVGSQANIGGAASAPVVASAFHPSLAPVGVLLAVLGYALGTYAAWVCGLLMQAVAPA